MSDRLDKRHAKIVSEAARERETNAYVESILQTFERHSDGEPSSDQLRTSPDPVLTALAQLATLRTKTSRSMISIFDKDHQYIAAESTPTTGLTPGLSHNRGEADLWLCGTAIPRQEGVCDFTLREGDHGSDIKFYPEANSSDAYLPVTKVDDLSVDDNFCAKPYCQPGSPAKFYAAVPIRTERRINIGVICVFHDASAPWWGDEQSQVLRELSHAIMEHWEATRSRTAHRRAERMTRGMGSFLEDKSTISGWREGLFPRVYDERKGSEGNLNREQQFSQVKADAALEHQAGIQGIPDTEPMPLHALRDQGIEDVDHWNGSRLTQSRSSDSEASSPAPKRHRVQTSTDHPSDPSQKRQRDINRVFDKAANLVRESLEVEGCLFLDPTLTTFGSLVGSAGHKPSPMTTTLSEQSSGEGEEKGASDPEPPVQYCRTLGFSTSSSHSINGDTNAQFEGTVAQKLTAVLLQRYPQGKIFNFDSNGELLTSDSSDDSTPTDPKTRHAPDTGAAPKRLQPDAQFAERKRKPWAREQEGKNISQIFPGARSVAFMPIWDSRKEAWFAASFTYTHSPTRAFTVQGELTYLKAFGMLAMEHILRLETMHADKAKSDALSCISHELRSPLHGILLGVELLNDTEINVAQGSMVHSLETCCRTMLDTVDHLLDFSNINNIARQSRRLSPGRSMQSAATNQPGLANSSSSVNLHKLAEEVIDSVFAGFQFQTMSVKQFARKQRESYSDIAAHAYMDGMHAHDEFGASFSAEPESFESSEPSRTSICNSVQVFFTVDPGCEWSFYGNSGALRRIVMNLFGNALKYTRKGIIKVSLAQKTPRTGSRTKTRQVLITVADTGIGMSQDYLQNQLFRPFAQENSLSPGTGLGLSLVRQLVSQMRGRISVDSQVGVGTTISVSLPLKVSANSTPSQEEGLADKLAEQAKSLHGLRVRLLGFLGDRATRSTRASTADVGDALSTMHRICNDWLASDVISEADVGDVIPDLILMSEDAYSTLRRDSQLANAPILVVCNNALTAYQQSEAHKASPEKSRLVEFVSQPIGPGKLTRMLSLLFDQWQQFQDLQAADRPHIRDSSTTLKGEAPVAREGAQVPEPQEKQNLAKSDSSASVQSRTPPPTPSQTDVSDRLETKSGTSTETAPSPEPRTQDGQAKVNTPDLNLPLRPTASDTTSPAAPSEPSFLLVDDNAINLKILKTYMTKLKCSFHGATNGQEAVEAFKTMSGGRKCVLMDISMPVMDGLEATRQIRSFESRRKLESAVIIALTGLGSQETQQAAFSSGVDLFLTKPVQLKELGDILTSKGLMPSQKAHN